MNIIMRERAANGVTFASRRPDNSIIDCEADIEFEVLMPTRTFAGEPSVNVLSVNGFRIDENSLDAKDRSSPEEREIIPTDRMLRDLRAWVEDDEEIISAWTREHEQA
jgi:hypothetical protein